MEDIFIGDYLMSEKDTAKYLGDYLSTNGSNRKTIEDRKAKGQGAINKIMSILDETCFGPFYFEYSTGINFPVYRVYNLR